MIILWLIIWALHNCPHVYFWNPWMVWLVISIILL